MSHCSVCQTPDTEGETTQCPTCGWDLTPVPHLIGELPEAYKQKETVFVFDLPDISRLF